MAKTGSSDLAKQEQRLAYWLLAPTFIILLTIAIYPLLSVFYNSFTNNVFASSAPVEFVGLENYQQLLSMTIKTVPPKLDDAGQPVVDPDTGAVQYESAVAVLPREPVRFRQVTQFNLFGTQLVLGATDPNFIRAVWDTIVFAVATVFLELVLGMIVALIVNANFKGRGFMRAIILIPWAIPTAVSSQMWAYMLQPNRTGFFNTVFWYLGLGNGEIPFLSDPAWQLPSMIMIDVWKTTPFMALLILAGLQLIPGDIYEAADVDGANPVRQFFQLTLPLMKGTIAVALVFRTLDALRVFDLFQIVLGQARYSMASFTYYQLIQNRQMGYSSASSVVIFVVLSMFAVIYMRSLGVKSDEQ
ncbi:MAG: sugar ABC transporter permease [Caldilinea sp.]|uniref:carbohydrate ABC transporter permease n=1 Tax=Caldilinea sp. TaxID=2293560 RepID=UPI002B9EDD71|nr:sugar ABC transporter permease [Anaerolineales bacterium]HQY91706.1 sugar ABC transporter permease [Caldilinea sp.]